ncbi:MAG: hypothetical protein WDN25_28255 [Acetobacteraceae bacterium]
MNISLSPAPLSLVLSRIGRALAAAPVVPSADDPVFLPDFATLTPDQAQEMRLSVARSRPRARNAGQ